jgi:release factor glutamine methyltransferase
LTPNITVRQAYQNAIKNLTSLSDSPASDAQLLLANTMNRNRAWVLAHPEAKLSSEEVEHYSQYLSRYRDGEALPYILGWWEFYGHKFTLNNSVLIPRPETEHIVEIGINYLRSNPRKSRALDIGTGSGCIAISMALELEQLLVVGTDLSWNALEVAKRNAKDHGVASQVKLVQMDLDVGLMGTFDIVCANLPYIPTAILDGLDVGKKEPRMALDGGIDGLRYIRPLLERLPNLLVPGGYGLFELEDDMGEAVLQLARTYLGNANMELLQDFAGHDRVLVVQL